ncbi:MULTISPECIES: GNAT family N-acetyltransferase [unclassified Bacillus (in: firmicutes)]|uniref:GNAT family N-acetyltransferase n=1 Tax=unclassified Bacillus (in: firmicutes) TaxID=185979 RepID=UPI0008E48D54|nr:MULTISPECIES: GNAT family N-acetyltransferase [unclassified Bacillus (in: firmicutes)]SFJ94968.1 Protein N-acetyltransferase, RimJ/RimL family [Bacillus sp. 71mf]SFS99391.1 Protein N-acetyltransferase, RimJ/RimL family [Bacillus sp. 103mf]
MKMLETERLMLRNWQESDYLDLYEYASDGRVGPNAGWAPHKNIEESKSIINMFIENGDSYAIVLKSENKVIGGLGLHDRIPDESLKDLKQREIGYVLNPKYWGKGYVPEVVNTVIKYGFEEMKLAIIWCGHYDFNLKSKRVVEKCGFNYKFSHDITLKQLEDKVVSSWFYNISKDEYYSRIKKELGTKI